ncbi:hypothetical protein C8R45DRAFT_1222945, partial [Mycena sanguinolenta]
METVTLDEATIAYDQRINRYLHLAGLVLLIYDHLLTLKLEVRFIWKPWRTKTSAWFLFVRYSSLCIRSMSLFVVEFGKFDRKRCTKLNTIRELLTVLQELFVGYTLVLRVLALYSFDKRVIIIVVTAAIICLSFAAWGVVPTGPSLTLNPSPSGCITPYTRTEQLREAGAWEAMLANNILLLVLTLYRAFTSERNIPTGRLWRVLIRDGVIYFAIICLMNFANIIMFYFGNAITSISLSGFTVSLSVAVLCRLMLNLHVA